MSERKYMDLDELRSSGLLFHINKEILHPIGLALEVTVEEDGSSRISGVWDARDDPEGITYVDEVLVNGIAKYEFYMERQGGTAMARRLKALGFIVQKPGDVDE